MLELLRIKNLALIEDAELEFGAGMNVITGETGSGKSFIIRALDFLTGLKMDASLVRHGAGSARVEALFSDGEEDIIIRREMNAASGRSRIFVNDRLSSKDTVAAMRATLFSHTSQHKQQMLLKPAYQGKVLDDFLPDTGLLSCRDQILGDLAGVLREKDGLVSRMAELSERKEFLEFQRAEIERVDPKRGEEQELVRRKEDLKERERASHSVESAMGAFVSGGSITDSVSGLLREVDRIAAIYPDFKADRDFLEETLHNLLDLETRLRGMPAGGGRDNELDTIESRLYDLSSLRRKLGRSLEEIVGLKEEIEDNLSFLDACHLDLKRLEKKELSLADELNRVTGKLNSARESTGNKVAERIEKELAQLGFSSKVRVRFDFSAHELYPGINENRARLVWAPNPGQSMQPLDKIASGGELSRFYLALEGLRSESGLPTLIFDEVDAGIGGMTLNAVADKLEALAGRRQLILITHWPQLAGKARRHYQVRKEVAGDVTTTSCQRLDEEAVVAELARMSGGGDKGRDMALKLFQENAEKRS